MLDDVLALASAEPASMCEWSRAGEWLELRVGRSDAIAQDRESIVRAGVALQSVRVLLRSEDALTTTEPMPDPGHPDLVARIRIDGFATASADDRALRAALTWRSTASGGAVGSVDPAVR